MSQINSVLMLRFQKKLHHLLLGFCLLINSGSALGSLACKDVYSKSYRKNSGNTFDRELRSQSLNARELSQHFDFLDVAPNLLRLQEAGKRVPPSKPAYALHHLLPPGVYRFENDAKEPFSLWVNVFKDQHRNPGSSETFEHSIQMTLYPGYHHKKPSERYYRELAISEFTNSTGGSDTSPITFTLNGFEVAYSLPITHTVITGGFRVTYNEKNGFMESIQAIDSSVHGKLRFIEYQPYQLNYNGLSRVISAMPGAGKSTLVKKLSEAGLKVSDSDSQRFHYLTNSQGQPIDTNGNVAKSKEDRVKNPNFLSDYLEHIRREITRNDLVFVSSHDPVRDALAKEGIPFDFVRYEEGMKNEVVDRIKNRKSNQLNEMIAGAVKEQWNDWMKNIDRPGPKNTFVLKPGQFLSDVLGFDRFLGRFQPSLSNKLKRD